MISVSAEFRKLRGTNDKGKLLCKFGNCGAVGIAVVLFCDSSYVFGVVDIFVLYSFIWASKSILFIDVEKILKNPAKIYVLRWLICLLVYV